ncbi:hypothetical protein CCACVL1_14997 [Corchorus capsularis]|uniref:Uncharacterized protein n=1 Tax=Corchorus capsularis TaxID=210143 RepID=A0A1R3I4I7_COCAP|nr:hypothetical protein CCACVL1_14997 [Corchorus capsularis]
MLPDRLEDMYDKMSGYRQKRKQRKEEDKVMREEARKIIEARQMTQKPK